MNKYFRIINLFLFLIICTTIMSVSCKSNAFAADTIAIQTSAPAVQSKSDITPEQKNLTEKQKPNIATKEAQEKTGFKYMIIKFFAAMFGVVISALAIFMGLKFYKKFILKNNSKFDNINYNQTLESPKDFKEVINLFLDKTDK